MPDPLDSPRYVFPRSANFLLPVLVLLAIGLPSYAWVAATFGLSPKTTDVGYAPEQPIPYSHRIHVGKLGLDCRYCHSTVERAAFAALPASQVCMNCHSSIKTEDPRLLPLRESWATGKPIEWVRVHRLPDYAYFDHSAHVTHGVGCVTCHGRIDRMDVVRQEKPLSMSWCLDCHRDPAPNLRPVDQVTNMAWDSGSGTSRRGTELATHAGIHDQAYMTSCSTCHR